MDYYSVLIDNLEANLLVFSRVLGIFAFNPILSRRNIPSMVKVITCIFITAVVIMVEQPKPIEESTAAGVYLMMILRETFIGVVIGFVTDMFFYSVQMSGEIMDMQAGLGMAKVFDPETNVQMSIMGSFVSFMMYLYFFVTNAHLTYIELFVRSFDIIPLGTGEFNENLGMVIIEYFTVILTLVIKLAMPITVAEMITQFCEGILMKSVPQIQIMVVSIQLKVGMGFLVLFLLAAPLANFIDKFMDTWLATLEGLLPLIPA
ncbi:MAG: flagellar biosynthetic protein FliR [Oscillospiraceae bacterium]|nr:flagellar biosynthetic protein FliR [Oscillospiraceae bacterium]